jgi:hypothetical protein
MSFITLGACCGVGFKPGIIYFCLSSVLAMKSIIIFILT